MLAHNYRKDSGRNRETRRRPSAEFVAMRCIQKRLRRFEEEVGDSVFSISCTSEQPWCSKRDTVLGDDCKKVLTKGERAATGKEKHS